MNANFIKPLHIEGDYAKRGSLTMDEPGVFEAYSLPWELMVNVKGKKRFWHWKDYFITPAITLYRESFQAAIRVTGLTPAGMLALSIPLQTGCATAYWNQPIKKGSLPIALPGELDSIVDERQSHIMLLINLELLRQHYTCEQIEKLEDSAKNHFLPSSSEKARQLADWLCKILAETSEDHSLLSKQSTVQLFEQVLLLRLAKSIEIPYAEKKRTHISLRQQGLKKALDYLYSADNFQANIPTLCVRSGVSQRTLEYAFQESFNMSPIEFVRKLRFHDFRRKLILSSTDNETIQNIAYDVGLSQLGRVAKEYKQLFDELPSETLKRNSDKTMTKKHVLLF